ncbi:unnamed protein product [Brassica rapa subsp. narinosa]
MSRCRHRFTSSPPIASRIMPPFKMELQSSAINLLIKMTIDPPHLSSDSMISISVFSSSHTFYTPEVVVMNSSMESTTLVVVVEMSSNMVEGKILVVVEMSNSKVEVVISPEEAVNGSSMEEEESDNSTVVEETSPEGVEIDSSTVMEETSREEVENDSNKEEEEISPEAEESGNNTVVVEISPGELFKLNSLWEPDREINIQIQTNEKIECLRRIRLKMNISFVLGRRDILFGGLMEGLHQHEAHGGCKNDHDA